MEYKRFNDIAPNNRTEFAMLYFAAMRTMRKLEVAFTLSRFLAGQNLFFYITCCKFSENNRGISVNAVSSPTSIMLSRFGMYAKFLM